MSKRWLRQKRPSNFFAMAAFACLLIATPTFAKSAAASRSGNPVATVKAQPESAAMAAPQDAAKLRAQLTDFKMLGVSDPIRLRGDRTSSTVPFSVRLDELPVTASLHLRFTASPALLPELSHLKIFLNKELIETVTLTKDQLGSEQQRNIAIDPRLLSDYNQLRIELIGHYTLDCEDPLHSSLWVEVDNRSAINLSLKRINLANDLALLPAPFFDRRDNRAVNLPMVFAHKPSQQNLRAAGVVASWLGALADYRSVHFSMLVGSLPQTSAIVFALNGDTLAGMDLPSVSAPTLSLRARSDDPSVKQLLIQGRNDADLEQAVNALVLGQVVLSGDTATVQHVELGEPRRLYDAPKWVRTDRPVRLAELVENGDQLQVRGYTPDPIRINARLPADLFTTFSRGVPINLKYRYTPPLDRDNSTLNININGQYVQTFRLEPSGAIGKHERLVLPLLDENAWNGSAAVLIPAFQVGSDNQLQFNFGFEQSRTGLCHPALPDNVQAALDPDSTIDFSDLPHYAAMPNLSAFANSGFPFTRYADLAQSAVVLPDNAGITDVEMMFDLLGKMGRWTGLPALRYRLVNMAEIKTVDAFDLLLVGGALQQSQGLGWEKDLPAVLDRNRRTFRPTDVALAPLFEQLNPHNTKAKWGAEVTLQSLGDLGAFISFESPLASERTVVAVTGSTPAAMRNTLDALDDGGLVRNIRGDVAFVSNHNASSYQVATEYYVGELSWWRIAWFHLAKHPVLLALAGLIASFIGAVFLYTTLKRRAEQRLRGHG